MDIQTETNWMEEARKFADSPDFLQGVIDATKASWGGDGYSVELYGDGTWRVQWNNMIGNLYRSPGIIVALPTADEEYTAEDPEWETNIVDWHGDKGMYLDDLRAEFVGKVADRPSFR